MRNNVLILANLCPSLKECGCNLARLVRLLLLVDHAWLVPLDEVGGVLGRHLLHTDLCAVDESVLRDELRRLCRAPASKVLQ